jgi:hypothetical protein
MLCIYCKLRERCRLGISTGVEWGIKKKAINEKKKLRENKESVMYSGKC